MKETINYYYNVYPEKVYEINNGCYFYFNTYKYYFITYDRDKSEIDFLVKITNDLYNRNILVDTFIVSKNKTYYVVVGEKIYVLLRVNSIENDIYNLSDIRYFNNLLITETKISLNSDWGILWKNKVDKFESEVSEFNMDYPLIEESFDYYIGLTENAISYFENAFLSSENVNVCLCHKRLPKNVYSGFINNPLTFAFDYEVRDVAEYIKVKFFEDYLDFNEVEDILSKFNRKSLMFLFSRLLYPSYYFDLVKKIIEEDEEEVKLLNYINRVNEYEDLLLDIYNVMNKKYNMPPVEWLKK